MGCKCCVSDTHVYKLVGLLAVFACRQGAYGAMIALAAASAVAAPSDAVAFANHPSIWLVSFALLRSYQLPAWDGCLQRGISLCVGEGAE